LREIYESRKSLRGAAKSHLTFRRILLWIASAGAVLATALLPGWANLTWQFGGDLYQEVTIQGRLKTFHFEVPVEDDFKYVADVSDFFGLITRYGHDQAFRDQAMATEKDKIDGQRQLRSVKVDFRRTNDRHHYLIFDLPVHLYLGTQFKLYAKAKDKHSVQEVKDQLFRVSDKTVLKGETCPNFFRYLPDMDQENAAKIMCVERGGTRFDRVFFLLNKFRYSLTGGGSIPNNFATPAGADPANEASPWWAFRRR
jgi:hypothetical protein